MEGADVKNKRLAIKPLTINLPDGRQIKSTHIYDIDIPGLPTALTGHIVPNLAIASLFGIRVLFKAGCKVVFDDDKRDIFYQSKLILRGYKDPSTDLWTLPIVSTPAKVWTTPATPAQGLHIKLQAASVRKACGSIPHAEATSLMTCGPINVAALPRHGPCIGSAPHKAIAGFTHSIKMRVNAVKFAHQSLCNPKISTRLKAVRKGFLDGCPNINVMLILKYLNPSPATAKRHMKRPRHGIKSTKPRKKATQPNTQITNNTVPMQPVERTSDNSEQTSAIFLEKSSSEYNTQRPTLIEDNSNGSIANVFVFGVFVDKNNGIVYHDLTGPFPFMSLDKSVCFFILYHYESNSILATPIVGLDDKSIFEAYKTRFRELEAKGFKPKLNVMDNQVTKHIKQFLTENECRLQLVEPHNHRVNAAERAIQTFKDAFIAALATTDSDFPLQLWDTITPQVQDTLNMMRASRVDPTKLAYEILNGPYDWNQYPLAQLGCKAVIYEDGDTRGSWASRGVDGWYLGPSKDHYRCDLYFIPETRACRISGSTELFPQHCQIPCLTKQQHFRALTEELTEAVNEANATPAGKRLVKALQKKIEQALNPNIVQDEQRVREDEQRVARENQQRVLDNTPILTIPRITDAPAIMQSRNPTAKRRLKENPRIHR